MLEYIQLLYMYAVHTSFSQLYTRSDDWHAKCKDGAPMNKKIIYQGRNWLVRIISLNNKIDLKKSVHKCYMTATILYTASNVSWRRFPPRLCLTVKPFSLAQLALPPKDVSWLLPLLSQPPGTWPTWGLRHLLAVRSDFWWVWLRLPFWAEPVSGGGDYSCLKVEYFWNNNNTLIY